jgi:hypothetical protein
LLVIFAGILTITGFVAQPAQVSLFSVISTPASPYEAQLATMDTGTVEMLTSENTSLSTVLPITSSETNTAVMALQNFSSIVTHSNDDNNQPQPIVVAPIASTHDDKVAQYSNLLIAAIGEGANETEVERILDMLVSTLHKAGKTDTFIRVGGAKAVLQAQHPCMQVENCGACDERKRVLQMV